jgi:D-alanyl-D-alanine carboxypeptidase (penicillin-binding protein 5/6)
MRRPLPRAFAAAATLALGVVSALGPASAAHAAGTIGGDTLATRGTVVHGLPGVASLPKVVASSFVLADLDTGQVLAARDPHGKYLPASTIKVLTAVTLLPLIPPTTPIVATYDDAAVEGTRVGIVEKMTYTADDLFRAMLMVSGNDAALALSHAVGGPATAVAKMNAEAQRLQGLDTTAKTVHGLDAQGQVTSAYDLALFGKAALQIPAFNTYVTTRTANFPAPPKKKGGKPTSFQIYTHDRLLTNYTGALGLKNGYTVAAQGTFVGAAERNGHRLIVTLMHADPLVWHDAAHLLDWGFANEDKVTPVGTLVDPVPPPGAAAANGDPSPSASADAVAPVPVADAAVARQSAASSNGAMALIGGIGGGVLLAGVAALAASRRRRDRFPDLDDGGLRAEAFAHPRGPEIVVPAMPERAYTSNIRVVQTDE